jgi:hypothetical protein
LTILRAMALVAIVGVILGLFAAYPQDQDSVAFFLISSLLILVPVHLAIEGNRRDRIEASLQQSECPDQDGSPRSA